MNLLGVSVRLAETDSNTSIFLACFRASEVKVNVTVVSDRVEVVEVAFDQLHRWDESSQNFLGSSMCLLTGTFKLSIE